MGATTGIVVQQNYAGAANDPARVQLLIDLIPNPDAPAGTGPAAAGGSKTLHSYLDEMSPAAAAQLLVELAALKAACT